MASATASSSPRRRQTRRSVRLRSLANVVFASLQRRARRRDGLLTRSRHLFEPSSRHLSHVFLGGAEFVLRASSAHRPRGNAARLKPDATRRARRRSARVTRRTASSSSASKTKPRRSAVVVDASIVIGAKVSWSLRSMSAISARARSAAAAARRPRRRRARPRIDRCLARARGARRGGRLGRDDRRGVRLAAMRGGDGVALGGEGVVRVADETDEARVHGGEAAGDGGGEGRLARVVRLELRVHRPRVERGAVVEEELAEGGRAGRGVSPARRARPAFRRVTRSTRAGELFFGASAATDPSRARAAWSPARRTCRPF